MKKIFLLLMVVLSSKTFAAPEQNEGYDDKCKSREVTKGEILNGLSLRNIVSYKINEIIESEKRQGRNPKVLIIGRAGQNMNGILTLKDQKNGRNLSVSDIMQQSITMTDNGTPNVSATQSEIKRNFVDKNRQLVYSHVALLIIGHPLSKQERVLNKDLTIGRLVTDADREAIEQNKIKTIGGGDYYVEELLKPCATLTPRAWVTGLSMFFQDDPFDYKAILMVPRQEIQDKVYDLLVSQDHYLENQTFNRFLGKTYNAAANYLNRTEQNSNQYVLELLMAGTFDHPENLSRLDVHPVLKKYGYRMTKVMAAGMRASFATSPFMPKSFNIHDSENPYARPYNVAEMVTELSIREFLIRNNIVSKDKVYEVELPESLRLKKTN
jgi:hypothetical protein